MTVRLLIGDCRERLRDLPDGSVNCCVTSPPYFGLRDYGHDGQIGLEATRYAFIGQMVQVFREVRRVLRDDGTLWLNLGDSYASDSKRNQPTGDREESRSVLPDKNLLGIPWAVAFALRADGWYLRQDIIWHKPNPMPESVRDRCTKAHEYIFLLSKGPKYYYDLDAIAEPFADERMGASGATASKYADPSALRADGGVTSAPTRGVRNKRSVWTVASQPYNGAHFATYPPDLIEPCILAGCPVGGTVLDPFGGAGTTGLVADRLQRDAILIELNPEYAEIARKRLLGDGGMFSTVEAA